MINQGNYCHYKIIAPSWVLIMRKKHINNTGMHPHSSCPSTEGVCCESGPIIVLPPRGVNWKEYGGKFDNISNEMKKVFEDAARRPRNDD